MKTLLSIIGPTASGKTALSIEIAQRLKAPIVSADSVQIYRGLDIGSGKVTEEEKQGVPHYMLDVVDPDQEFSAGDFGRAVDKLLEELFAAHDVVILVGGAGFYLNAVWEGMDDIPAVDPAVREALNQRFAKGELRQLIQELREVDPATFEVIDRSNPVRIIRALEVYYGSGKPISYYRARRSPKEKNYADLKIGLELERDVLYPRINARVDQMRADGLEKEVRDLVEQWGADAKGLRSVGYRELVDLFAGKHDRDEAIRLIKRNSRRYAKKQYTWFRKVEDIQWFSAVEPEVVVEEVVKRLGTGSGEADGKMKHPLAIEGEAGATEGGDDEND